MMIIKCDVTREIRKNHITGMENGNDIVSNICETLAAQQFIGSLVTNKIAVKWQYSSALMLSSDIEYVVLSDQTAPQFIYHTKLSNVELCFDTYLDNVAFMNPGNFSQKGEFMMVTFDGKKLNPEACSI